MTIRSRSVPPRASVLMEALRGLGYSTAAAIADIIDNSISAAASIIDIRMIWAAKDSWISISDDGSGMSDAELENAMRLGTHDPNQQRASTDLGRFGMGLKTASLSQCRSLTVKTQRINQLSACLRWDLDALQSASDGDWCLLEGCAHGSEARLESTTSKARGTTILWERLDRIVSEGFSSDDFGQLAEDIDRRLAMTFHRLLEGPSPRIRIGINGRPVRPWDPFMTGHPSKPWESARAMRSTPSGIVRARCHVLPHKDRLTAEEYESSAGPEGWNTQQGFYIYRGDRLLVAGGWLGLGQGRSWNREEAYRLARISVDIPNSADHDWKIDIRKSTARPPTVIRDWLANLADQTRNRARRVFAYRGTPEPKAGVAPVVQTWRAEHTRAGIRYRIDEDHPAVSSVLDSSGTDRILIRIMLRIIEETVPVQKIWLDTAEQKETPLTGFSGAGEDGVREVIAAMYSDLTTRRGMTGTEAKKLILKTEPFNRFELLVSDLPE